MAIAAASTSSPLDVLWQPRSLLWVALVGALIASILALSPGVNGDRWNYFGLSLLVIQWVSALTLGSLYVSRRRLVRLRPTVIAYVAVAVLVASTWLVGTLAWFLIRELSPQADDGWRLLMLRLSGIALSVGALGLAAFRNHWHARQAALRAKQAELESLQARIRPHFLFNTLNTGAALVHQRPEEAERLLLDLADLFRAALAGPRDIPLEEELSLARRYLEIEALRFGDRLRVDWQLPAVIPDVMVPALSIQPLVENAIRHGVERVQRGGRIEIALTSTPEHVVVRISNPLVLGDSQPPASHKVGLSAAQARIEALTGGRGSVQTQVQGEHYVATVRLPLQPLTQPARRRGLR